MIDMKSSPEEMAEQATIGEAEQNPYPYGLQIRLNDDDLAKLGITSLPAVGSKISFSAMANVCSTSAYSDKEGEAETSMSLQITGMEITSAGQSTNDAAGALYGTRNDPGA
jgi:hypothetical protein